MIGPRVRVITAENNKAFVTASDCLLQYITENGGTAAITDMTVSHNSKGDDLTCCCAVSNDHECTLLTCILKE
jgi:hypothetical protein